MFEIEIQCPVHGAIEVIELPDGYKDFEGEVVCPTPMGTTRKGGAQLRVKIKDFKVTAVERSR